MHDIVKIDRISLRDRRGAGALKTAPPPGSLAVSNTPDRIDMGYPFFCDEMQHIQE